MFKRTGSKRRFLALLIVCIGVLSFYGTLAAAPLSGADYKIAERAFTYASKKQFTKAENIAATAKSALPGKLVRWMRIVEPGQGLPFHEIASFMAHNPDWPRQSTLQRRAEEALDKTIDPANLMSWFAGREALTSNGHIMIAFGLEQLGRMEELRLHVQKSWREVDFGRAQQKDFYKNYGQFLSYEDHIARLDRLLWEGRTHTAGRMLPYVKKDWQALAKARITLRRMRGGVDGAINRVPAHLKNHPGLVYERMRWRRIKGRDQEARDLILGLKNATPYPEIWWRQRAILSRSAVRDGHYSEAYRLSANHGLDAEKETAKYAEAEWLSGWITLRFLQEPDKALTHFTNMFEAVSYPVSRSRGAYWIARSYRDLKRDDLSKQWFAKAAQYPTTYYGQLANEHLEKRVAIRLNEKAIPNSQEKAVFQESELVSVVRFMEKMQEREYMRHFIYQLNTMSTTAGWRTLVAELAIQSGRPDLAVYVGKKAHQRGQGMIEAAYPLLPSDFLRTTPETALVHSIVRQESAFYDGAISRAGARGLMQLMPRTARNLAKQKNYRYSRKKLITSPKMNVWLGSEYLDDLLLQFDGSYVLSLASYNAGPYRARQWIEEFGDPRTDDKEYVIDWVEQIPFSETRNYVQRVLENLQVYRYRLKGVQVASTLSKDLKRKAE